MTTFLSTLLLSTLLFATGIQKAEAQTTFEEFQQQQQTAMQEFEQLDREGMILDQEAFEAFQAEYEAQFNAFREDMEQQWGDFRERTQRNWTEYRENGTVRWDVDFEEGTVEIEVLAEEDDTEEDLREKIKQAVVDLSESRATRSEMPDDTDEVLEEPVLKDQIALGDAENTQELADKLAESAVVEERNSETIKRVMRVNLALLPDHIRTRAERFQDYLSKNTELYDLDPALILAIIHTESYFNPVARSHANALGLMQIVPSTAGRDVYRRLRNEDGVPSPEFLYEPDNNLLFGCTYFDILFNQYIRGVESQVVLEYMAISAYNTGAGNVARAYTGNTNIRQAVRVANGMSDQENYDHLVANLPYEETRNYIQKVTERRDLYQEWITGD